jgi:type II secretory pathway component PulJ
MPDIASTTDPAAMTLAAVALLIALAVLVLLVLVLVGIRAEERHMSLTSAPRTRVGAMTRHLTGVGVRTPEANPCKDQDPDSCPGRHLT